MNWTRRRLLRAIPLGVGAGLAGCNGTGDEETPDATESRAASTSTRSGRSGGTERTRTRREATGGPSTTGASTPSTSAREPSTPGTWVTTNRTATWTTGDFGGRTEGTTGPASHSVGMYTGLYFDPVGLSVEPGETVAFENVSGSHSATAFHPEVETYSIAPERRVPDGSSPWNTGVLYEPGATKRVTFETPGTYDYFCIPHVQTGMVGRVVVGEPGGPATESRNPYANAYPLPDSERIVAEGQVAYEAVAPTLADPLDAAVETAFEPDL